ncbi:hypothetical protein AXG93_411s1270 [Marchantia polymorpha subsp. ruderalis]|uniref:Uncharacterized protein n=1 Tax=Marchantia polymorpha subsp. ruderalis TaxID=1480154 RepID=A0A176VHB2_MARPO|nr:hypothetical protein AXG93_411s1270 [Marchantia polymorpha subsp. ruderalis]
MGLLTREEAKRLPREREVLTAESSEGTEDDTSIPSQTTAQGPIQMDVVRRREKPERRLAKRRKVVSDDEGDLVLEYKDSSVEKTVAPIMYAPEVAVGESTQPVEAGGSLSVLIEVPADTSAKPLKEGTNIVSLNSLSSERTRSARSEETLQRKTNDELVKELTLSEEILEQVVAQIGGTVTEAADVTLPSTPVEDVRPEEMKETSSEEVKTLEVTFPDFLQDSVVPLLKYLDGKRVKYDVYKEVGFYVELIRNRTQLKRAAVKREWDSATKLARERAASLETECAAVKVTL